MANTKISELPLRETLTGSEEIPFADSETNGKLTPEALDKRYVRRSSANDGMTTIVSRNTSETDSVKGGSVSISCDTTNPDTGDVWVGATDVLGGALPRVYIRINTANAVDDPQRRALIIGGPRPVYYSNDPSLYIPMLLCTDYAKPSFAGVIKTGYEETEGNYAVKVDTSANAYVTIPEATTETAGLMSAADKQALQRLLNLLDNTDGGGSTEEEDVPE